MKSLPRAVRKSRKISPQNIQPYPSPTSILKFAGCNFKLAAVFLLLLAKGLCRGKKLYLIFLLSSSPNACRRRRCYRMCGYLFLTRDCGLLITILFFASFVHRSLCPFHTHYIHSPPSIDRPSLPPITSSSAICPSSSSATRIAAAVQHHSVSELNRKEEEKQKDEETDCEDDRIGGSRKRRQNSLACRLLIVDRGTTIPPIVPLIEIYSWDSCALLILF